MLASLRHDIVAGEKENNVVKQFYKFHALWQFVKVGFSVIELVLRDPELELKYRLYDAVLTQNVIDVWHHFIFARLELIDYGLVVIL